MRLWPCLLYSGLETVFQPSLVINILDLHNHLEASFVYICSRISLEVSERQNKCWNILIIVVYVKNYKVSWSLRTFISIIVCEFRRQVCWWPGREQFLFMICSMNTIFLVMLQPCFNDEWPEVGLLPSFLIKIRSRIL